MSKKHFYITTAIAYLNGEPHIGHALEIIQADCLARFYRLIDRDLVFQTGSDEHGLKIYATAKKEGMEILPFVNKYYNLFIKLYKTLNISYDRYCRTTSEVHKKGASKLWLQMVENDDLYKAEYSGNYCVGCESYKTANELVDGKCPNHYNREIIELKEENYFFRLKNYVKKLLDIYNNDEIQIIPSKRKAEIIGILKSELEDVSFSRQKKKMPWGIPVPNDSEHVMYVWADALSNYITNIGYERDEKEFNSIWPADIQLIGKDILKFHAIYWPAMLLSVGVPLLKKLYVHGFVTIEGGKIGKSLGNVVDPFVLVKKYGVDPFRFYLLKNIPSFDDGSFRESDLVEIYNTSLADDLGNLILRVLTFIKKDFNNVIPKLGKLEKIDDEFIKKFDVVDSLKENMDNFRINKALEIVWNFVKETNRYINETAPWQIRKDGLMERYGTVLYVLVEALRVIGIYIEPFIPSISDKLYKLIGLKPELNFKNVTFRKNTAGKIGKKEVFFPKIGVEKKEDPYEVFDFKVGKVTEVQKHPDSEKMYVLKVDIGEIRTLCAKIANFYDPSELLDKTLVVLTNMEPREILGIKSEGMLIGGLDAEKQKVMLATVEAEPGEQIYVGDTEPKPGIVTPKKFNKTKLKTKDKKIKIGISFLKTRDKFVEIDLKDNVRLK